MNVSLTPELEQFVQEKVSSGLYYSASEVIREGLRLLKEREQLQQPFAGVTPGHSDRLREWGAYALKYAKQLKKKRGSAVVRNKLSNGDRC